MTPPFTPEQERTLRQMIRDELIEDKVWAQNPTMAEAPEVRRAIRVQFVQQGRYDALL